LTDELHIQLDDKLFTVDDFSYIEPDIIIDTDDDEVHRELMKRATFRLGDVKENFYVYLINGKTVQVRGKEKKK